MKITGFLFDSRQGLSQNKSKFSEITSWKDFPDPISFGSSSHDLAFQRFEAQVLRKHCRNTRSYCLELLHDYCATIMKLCGRAQGPETPK